jgi:tetraacyldisaccharide 4'-kinase
MQGYLYNLATDRKRGFLSGIFKVFLFALSLIYGLIVVILIFINKLKCRRLNVRVISVGNITLGGTGKTSLVECIARYLKGQGHKVAILSRGYKRKVPDPCLSLPVRQAGGRQAESPIPNYETMGDEPYMLFRNLVDIPVIVDTDRIKAARKATKDYHVDTVILDDGFQQWKIKKDLEIVTIDATNPLGNKHLLPRGILREPLSGLRRADIFVLTKTNLKPAMSDTKDFLNQINPEAIIIESMHKPLGFYNINQPEELLSVDILKGKTVTLFSGIGSPDSFEDLIKSLGIKVGLSFRFPDHHNYTGEDLERIVRSSKNKNIDTIITTAKDAVKIYRLKIRIDGGRFLCLRITLEITDEQRFYNRLLQLYPL